MITAIVFDFDGVLADSEVLHLRAYQQVLAPLGAELSRADYFARYLGFDDAGVFRTFGADHGLGLGREEIADLIARKSAVFEALEASADMLFPGAERCVRRLAEDFPLGIASGAMRHESRRCWIAAGCATASRFIVASGDTPRSKPAPDPYLRAAALHAARAGGVRGDRGLELGHRVGTDSRAGVRRDHPRPTRARELGRRRPHRRLARRAHAGALPGAALAATDA